MQQALRSLANNLLWDGEDVKAQYGVSSMYDISAWSTPYIWGYTRAKIDAPFSAWLKKVEPAEPTSSWATRLPPTTRPRSWAGRAS